MDNKTDHILKRFSMLIHRKVDQVGRTARQMTYFLSSRARRFKKTYHHYLVNFYFHKLMYRYKKYLQW